MSDTTPIRDHIVANDREAWGRHRTLNNQTALRSALRDYQDILDSWRENHPRPVPHSEAVEKRAIELSLKAAGWGIVYTIEYDADEEPREINAIYLLNQTERDAVRKYIDELKREE